MVRSIYKTIQIERKKFEKEIKKSIGKDRLFLLDGRFIDEKWIYKHDFINYQWFMWLEAKCQASKEREV